jgi:hypothetical protein
MRKIVQSSITIRDRSGRIVFEVDNGRVIFTTLGPGPRPWPRPKPVKPPSGPVEVEVKPIGPKGARGVVPRGIGGKPTLFDLDGSGSYSVQVLFRRGKLQAELVDVKSGGFLSRQKVKKRA